MTGLVGPTVGTVAHIEAAPGTVLLDATGKPVKEVSEFSATMLASGASFSSLRSYGMALLWWWRFLAAIEVPWQHASRIEARDFVLWMRLVGPIGGSAGTRRRLSITRSRRSSCSTLTGSALGTDR